MLIGYRPDRAGGEKRKEEAAGEDNEERRQAEGKQKKSRKSSPTERDSYGMKDRRRKLLKESFLRCVYKIPNLVEARRVTQEVERILRGKTKGKCNIGNTARRDEKLYKQDEKLCRLTSPTIEHHITLPQYYLTSP